MRSWPGAGGSTTWTVPDERQITRRTPRGDEYRTEALADQWELYDLDADPIERVNRWRDESVAGPRKKMVPALAAARPRSQRSRNVPWPYESRADDPPAAPLLPIAAKNVTRGTVELVARARRRLHSAGQGHEPIPDRSDRVDD